MSLLIPKPEWFEQISLPVKETNQVDWEASLKEYIFSIGDNAEAYSEEVMKFSRMRQDCRGAPNNPVGIEIIVSYYRQLDFLSKRLPLGEHPLSVDFVWSDVIQKSSFARQGSLAFEKANVLFNAAALYSQTSAVEDATKNFQSAASLLTYIADNFLHPPLDDISRSCLTILSDVMMAQSQEAITLQSISSDKSGTTIGKLACATARLFAEVCRKMDSSEYADISGKFLSSSVGCFKHLSNNVHQKARIWGAISSCYLGGLAYEQQRVGDSIARLARAAKFLEEIGSDKHMKSTSDYASTLSQHVAQRRAALEKENSLIYNQKVSDASLMDVEEGTLLVQIYPPSVLWKGVQERPDIFKRIVPFKYHEENSKYSEEKAKLLRYEILKTNAADAELQATFTTFGFPASFEKLCKSSAYSNDRISSIREYLLKACNDFSGARDAFKGLCDTFHAKLVKTSELLDDEIVLFQRGRLQHGQNWTQRPSHDGNTGYFSEVGRIEAYFHDASLKFEEMLAIFDNLRIDYRTLVGSEGELVSALKCDSGDEAANILNVRQMVEELESLSHKRSVEISRLKDAMLNDSTPFASDFSKISELPSLFEKEIQKFDSSCSLIEENVEAHNRLITDFRTAWNSVSKHLGAAKCESDASKRLLNSGDQLCAMHRTIKYTTCDLCPPFTFRLLEQKMVDTTNELEGLLGRVNEFCVSRAAERDCIEKAMIQQSSQQEQVYLMEKLKNLSIKSNAPEYRAQKRQGECAKFTEGSQEAQKLQVPSDKTLEPSLLD